MRRVAGEVDADASTPELVDSDDDEAEGAAKPRAKHARPMQGLHMPRRGVRGGMGLLAEETHPVETPKLKGTTETSTDVEYKVEESLTASSDAETLVDEAIKPSEIIIGGNAEKTREQQRAPGGDFLTLVKEGLRASNGKEFMKSASNLSMFKEYAKVAGNLNMLSEKRPAPTSGCPVAGGMQAGLNTATAMAVSSMDPSTWEVLKAIVDSGATVPVLHPKTGQGHRVEESPASNAGVEYDRP